MYRTDHIIYLQRAGGALPQLLTALFTLLTSEQSKKVARRFTQRT
ncbi:hypothetical protein [Rhodohalobacter barkolensis]|nr:hypothetical protein [Rhodohalobacter barkolensis]